MRVYVRGVHRRTRTHSITHTLHTYNTNPQAEPLPTTSTISSSSSSTSTDQPPQPVSTRPLTFFAPRALMRGKRALAAPVGRLAVAAVPTKGEGEGKEGEGKGKEQGNVKLSNDDFRKMMLGGGGK